MKWALLLLSNVTKAKVNFVQEVHTNLLTLICRQLLAKLVNTMPTLSAILVNLDSFALVKPLISILLSEKQKRDMSVLLAIIVQKAHLKKLNVQSERLEMKSEAAHLKIASLAQIFLITHYWPKINV